MFNDVFKCYGKFVFLVSLAFVYLRVTLRMHFSCKQVRFMHIYPLVMHVYQKFIFTET